MKAKGRILLVAILGTVMSACVAGASTTKVGNGDDGRDLEGATPIHKGVLVETRTLAVEQLKKLNIGAVQGLGLLIPEVEKSELFLVQKAVEEATDSEHGVYARTFSEPHAPTRFFPAALMLNTDQLVALHIHEGLHRALPADQRENEDVVARLTMAMTTPGATFDRVNRVATQIFNPRGTYKAATAFGTSKLGEEDWLMTPKPARVFYRAHALSAESFSDPWTDKSNQPVAVQHGLGGTISPLGVTKLKGMRVEPQLEVEALLVNSYRGPRIGPIRSLLKLSHHIDNEKSWGPSFQITTVAMDEPPQGNILNRQVNTFGFFYVRETNSSYFGTSFNYTTSSAGRIDYTGETQITSVKYLPRATWEIHSGWKSGKFKIGWDLNVYMSQGNKYLTESSNGFGDYSELIGRERNFSITTLGATIGYSVGKIDLEFQASGLLTTPDRPLGKLGDPINIGTGRGNARLTVGSNF